MSKVISVPAAGIEGFGKNAHLIHAVEIDEAGDFIRVLCNRIKIDHLLDDSITFNAHSITCPICAKRAA